MDVTLVIREMLQLLRVSISKHVILQLDQRENIPAVQASPRANPASALNLITNASDEGNYLRMEAPTPAPGPVDGARPAQPEQSHFSAVFLPWDYRYPVLGDITEKHASWAKVWNDVHGGHVCTLGAYAPSVCNLFLLRIGLQLATFSLLGEFRVRHRRVAGCALLFLRLLRHD
jgi:hypothetical protein